MQADRQKWNRRFADKPLNRPQVPGFLQAAWDRLQPGTALELACGDGAGALYLAEQGFAVTAVDIAEVALERLKGFAEDASVSVDTRALDLDDLDALPALGRFDNLLAFHFKPAPALWARLPELLVPGGRLMLSTFNLEQHRAKGFAERFCLAGGGAAGPPSGPGAAQL